MASRRSRFSARTAWARQESPLAQKLAALTPCADRVDLTVSNPTSVGLSPTREALAPLAHPRGATYHPHSFGDPSARAAAAADASRRARMAIDPARVVMSASTSEAYGWLFSLLCDRGDEVLVPRPSYPLFDWLARLAEVTLSPYPLSRASRFAIDVDAVEAAITPRTRAILVVAPNNPTGTLVRRADADALERIAADHGLALIVDEVFGDYAFPTADRLSTFLGRDAALTFVLDGLSKKLALPQLKVAWTTVDGPPELVAEALGRLELIADTYLSVGTPPMRALEDLLALREATQARIIERLTENLAALDHCLEAAASVGARRLPLDGGWSAVIEIPRTRDEEDWCVHLAASHGVLVQPGFFYDFDQTGHLVVSLLPEPSSFVRGARRLARGLVEL
jgi:aspartate/methionine/tyrosine aminotransferase